MVLEDKEEKGLGGNLGRGNRVLGLRVLDPLTRSVGGRKGA